MNYLVHFIYSQTWFVKRTLSFQNTTENRRTIGRSPCRIFYKNIASELQNLNQTNYTNNTTATQIQVIWSLIIEIRNGSQLKSIWITLNSDWNLNEVFKAVILLDKIYKSWTSPNLFS